MFAKIMSTLALVAAAQASSLGEASRRLQGAADVCSPSDAELLTLIEIVLAQNEKLTQQTTMISCLTTCQNELDADCDCASGVAPPPTGPPPPPSPPGDTANTAMTIQVSPEYQASLGTDAAFDDCFLTLDEINEDDDAQAFAAAFIAETAARLGVSPDSITINGISTDGDNEPGCNGETANVNTAMAIQVSPEYQATLGTDAAFDDCFLTLDEINEDDDAAAFAAAFIATTAAHMGVSPDSITINGISTDGDNEPGCSGEPAGGQVGTGMVLQVTPEFQDSLGHPAAFLDCWLSPEEIASDDDAAAFAEAFRQSSAESLGVAPSEIVLDGISTAGLNQPGCAPSTSGAAATTGLSVSEDFAASIADSGGFEDCVLDADEIAADEDAQAMALAFAQTQAAALGVDVEDITITGIEATAGIGCSQVPHAAASVSVGVTNDFVASMGEGQATGFLDDCYISAEEIDTNPNAAALAQAFINTQAATLGVDPETITVTGFSTDDDDTPGCSGSSGRRLETTSQLKVGMSIADTTQLPKHMVSSFTINK
eukprot:SAG31_NODE_769_length_12212_cov_5.357508_2_plen_544_part_00